MEISAGIEAIIRISSLGKHVSTVSFILRPLHLLILIILGDHPIGRSGKNQPGGKRKIAAPDSQQPIYALRESEERYRGLVESVYDWIWEVDADNVYTYSSPRSYDVLGYRPEELIGKRPTEFMTPEESRACPGNPDG